jgi:hypothetical protein
MVDYARPARGVGRHTQFKRMTDYLARNRGDQPSGPNLASRRGLIFAGCLVLLGLLGYLDYITGYEMSFFVFYSVPVGVAAWWMGRWPAIALALAATVTWLLADAFSGAKYSAPFFYYWNSTIHFLAFMINAVTIAKIKSDLDRRQALAVELESARQALRDVSALLPACPACGRPREGAAGSGTAEIASLARERSELASAFCAECRANGAKAQAKTDYASSSCSSSSS